MQSGLNISNANPSFGIVRYGKGVEEHIRKMGHHTAITFRVIGIRNRENPIGIDLSVVRRFGKDRLAATVGCKTFVENIILNPICTLKRAIKNADKIYAHQQYMRELTKGMKIPVIK